MAVFLLRCAISVNRNAQYPYLLFLLFKEIGLPVTAPTFLSLNFSSILSKEFLAIDTSPSVRIKISPFVCLTERFNAAGLPFPKSFITLKFLYVLICLFASFKVGSSGEITTISAFFRDWLAIDFIAKPIVFSSLNAV